MQRSFWVPGQPQGKARAKVTVIAGHAHAYTPEKTALYEAQIISAYEQRYHDHPLLCGALRIFIRAVFPIIKSESKCVAMLMLAGVRAPTKKPDFDNIAKVICDALKGIAYGDDTQIVTASFLKEYGEKPGVYVLLDDNWKEIYTATRSDIIPF
jgi:Holliday junction resolvase RusA-like endonuclease